MIAAARHALLIGLGLLASACGGGGDGGGAGALGDWTTFQRDAAHTGYVDVTLDPAKFTLRWTWSRPADDSEPIGGINAVATGAGQVFVTKDVYFGQATVYALDEATGRASWYLDFGRMASMGPPAYASGRVYVPTTDQSSRCVVWAVDALRGAQQPGAATTTCQWSNYFAPTTAFGALLQTSQAGTVYSFRSDDLTAQWSAPAGAFDQTTPAADARFVYQYGADTAPGLRVFDRASGAAVATIGDPLDPGFSGYSTFSAPMLGARGNAIAFSGGGFSGRAASSSEQSDARVLVSYDVAGRAVAWRSSDAYLTHPALAAGVVYAARNAPAELHALSEVDGRKLWSWSPPAGDTSFHRNVVVTRNLLFVSTDANVYAIDLATRLPVWHYPKPGMLAISANRVLYIATGATLSDGGLVAIGLD